ncbi:MAG: hypothetical protein MZV65_31570 [Chromatiales bacterium]|nr:hypothetical protein [Chromatiales bacterium]
MLIRPPSKAALSNLLYEFTGTFLSLSTLISALHRAAGPADVILVSPTTGLAYHPGSVRSSAH